MENNITMPIHHIGYAVQDIKNATSIFSSLGYTVDPAIYDFERNVAIAFAVNGAQSI